MGLPYQNRFPTDPDGEAAPCNLGKSLQVEWPVATHRFTPDSVEMRIIQFEGFWYSIQLNILLLR